MYSDSQAHHEKALVGLNNLLAFGEGTPKDFVPLTIRASQEHGEHFQMVTDRLMDRINDLLPDDYKFSDQDENSDGGAERFV